MMHWLTTNPPNTYTPIHQRREYIRGSSASPPGLPGTQWPKARIDMATYTHPRMERGKVRRYVRRMKAPPNSADQNERYGNSPHERIKGSHRVCARDTG
eukprot:484167-Amorphochlora_amoeboformis.AAC.1